MSDTAHRLAQALRDVIKEAVQEAVGRERPIRIHKDDFFLPCDFF